VLCVSRKLERQMLLPQRHGLLQRTLYTVQPPAARVCSTQVCAAAIQHTCAPDVVSV
jgi:hypothetical protein